MEGKEVIIQKGYIKMGYAITDIDGNVTKEEGGWVNDTNGHLLAIGVEGGFFGVALEDDKDKLYELVMKCFNDQIKN